MKKVYQYDNVIPSGKIVHFYRKNHFNLFMLRDVFYSFGEIYLKTIKANIKKF